MLFTCDFLLRMIDVASRFSLTDTLVVAMPDPGMRLPPPQMMRLASG
jgi:hypothetical protein